MKTLITLVLGVTICSGAYAADLGLRLPGDELSGSAILTKFRTAKVMSLSQQCALASILIRDNNCKPLTCDQGLGRALRAGCRINHWGHTPR